MAEPTEAIAVVPPPEGEKKKLDHPLTYDEFIGLVQQEIEKHAAAYTQELFNRLNERGLLDERSFRARMGR